MEETKWISVEDRLPETDDEFLIVCEDVYYLAEYTKAFMWRETTEFTEVAVSYWMELPKHPKY